MSIIKKNPNEIFYPDGKKPFYSVIKNDGPEDVLCWKFLAEDFNENSQLIVAESEEALFFKNGIIEQIFNGGKYTLSTNNYPFLSRLRTMFSGGESAYNCKIYFVSKAHKLELLWGTDTPIQLRDPKYKIQTSIKARGSYSIQVIDSKKLLIKLIGNNVQMFTKEELVNYFRSAFLQYIKSGIAKVIKDSNQEILGIIAEADMIASGMFGILNEVLNEYGVRVVNFYISGIDIPENDPHRLELDRLYTQNSGIEILGSNWGRIKADETIKVAVGNPGGIAGMGAQVGIGLGIGNQIGNDLIANTYGQQPVYQQQTQDPIQPQSGSRFTQKSNSAPHTINCPKCTAVNLKNAKFCNQCGEPIELILCSKCGSKLESTAKFCDECGNKVM